MRVILLLSVLVTFAYGRITLTNKQLEENIKSCLAKTKLSQNFFKASDESLKYLTDEQKSCFLACMFKSAGIIQDDGSIRAIEDVMDQTTADVITSCTEKANSDICKLAWCLHKSQKFGIDILPEYPRYN